MGSAITVLSISCAYALFLVLRVKSVFGTKILVLSGDNLFNAKGIQLSEGGLFFLWLIAVAGMGTGIYMLIKSLQGRNRTGIENQTGYKICPMCAETIKLEAKICKHCRNEFSYDDIENARKEAVKGQSSNASFDDVTNDDPVSEEEILSELENSSQLSDYSPSELKEMGIPYDEIDDEELVDKGQNLEELAEKYESIKGKIIETLKNEVVKADELKILEGLACLDLYQIQEMRSHPEDLTTTGANVFSLLEKRINSALQNS